MFKGSLIRAAGFELFHVPIDVGTVYLLTGSIGGSIIFVAFQHTLVFCVHTVYDRLVYNKFYKGGKQ
jgi:uncharacterized membrane protein